MGTIEQQLAAHAIIGLDTAVFIYHFEANPRYQPLTTLVLNSIQAGARQAILSTIALMELAVHPWRMKRPQIAHQYEALLVHFPHLQFADVTRDVARRAAQLRAAYNIQPADALHIATALINHASAFVTNDKGLARLHPELSVIILDDHL